MTTFAVGKFIPKGDHIGSALVYDTGLGQYVSQPYYSGNEYVYTNTTEAHITKTSDMSPIINLDVPNIQFSSLYFDYLAANRIVDFTINLPGRNLIEYSTGKKGKDTGIAPNVGSATYLVYNGLGLSYTPLWIAYNRDTGAVLTTSSIESWSSSMRAVHIVTTSNEIQVLEQYQAYNQNIPAQTLNIRVLILDQSTSQGRLYPADSQGVGFSATPSRTTIGNGKIDSTRRYVFVDESSLTRLVTERSIKTWEGNYSTSSSGGTICPIVSLEMWRDGAVIHSINYNTERRFPNVSDFPGVGKTVGITL